MTQPAEGLYLLGDLDYNTVDAVNMSTLVHMAISPKLYRYRLQHPKEQTEAMLLGVATDMAVYEPDRFSRSYAVWTGIDEETGKKRIRSGKYWEEFQRQHADRDILTQEQYDSALNMRRVIEADPLAMSYLESGTAQNTLIWRDKDTGILCKGRTDWITTDGKLVDLKTSNSVEPWKFCKTGANLFYHVKMAWYADAIETLTCKPPREVVLIAAESAAPYDVVVYDLDDEQVLDYGRAEYREWLTKLARCRDTNRWPGVANGQKMPFVLPKYLRKDDEDLDGLDFGDAT